MTGYIVKFDDAEIVKLSKEYGYGTPKKLIEVAVKWLSDCREELIVPESKTIGQYMSEEYNSGFAAGYANGYTVGYDDGYDDGCDDGAGETNEWREILR
jgi:hypothetical protein